MSLVANGKLSLGDISQEFGYPVSTPITLKLQNSGDNKQVYINNNWVNLNPCSTFQPDVIAPHSITEWYRYDHNELCPTTTTTTTVSPCIAITDFSYKINGVDDWNSFTLNGVQDINISFNSYSPDGYGTPLEYEYNLDGSGMDIIVSDNTKTFVNVNVGDHTLIIRVWNCNRTNVKTKVIGFAISDVTTTTTTTTSTTTTTTTNPTCVPVTDFTLVIPNSTYPSMMEIRANNPNGTSPWTYSFTIVTPSRTLPTVTTQPLDGGAGAFYPVTCDDIGEWNISITVTNCSGVGSITKTGVSYLVAPQLLAPLLSSCKYLDNDGVLRASLLAYGYNSAATLKVYKSYNDEYIGDMTDGVYSNILIISDIVEEFYIKQHLCQYVSGRSNESSVSFAIPNC